MAGWTGRKASRCSGRRRRSSSSGASRPGPGRPPSRPPAAGLSPHPAPPAPAGAERSGPHHPAASWGEREGGSAGQHPRSPGRLRRLCHVPSSCRSLTLPRSRSTRAASATCVFLFGNDGDIGPANGSQEPPGPETPKAPARWREEEESNSGAASATVRGEGSFPGGVET